MKRILIGTLIIATTMFGLYLLVGVNNVFAQPKEAVCDGLSLTGADCGGNAEGEVSSTVQTVVTILSFVVGIAAVIMVIIGGFKYVASSGDPAGTNSAKNTILFALIGLVIVALAQVIVRFVLNQV